MMQRSRAFRALGGLACSLALVVTTLPASAATGIAWDSVTRFQMGSSGTPQPGDFTSDFQTGSQPAQVAQQGGGMFGAIGSAMGAARSSMQMMQNGFAEHHYVAGNLRRTDNIPAQIATITDCTARTITTLDLAKKTYRVDSLDAPQAGRGGGPMRGGPGQDDDSKVSINLTTTPIGAKNVWGNATSGYQSNLVATVTHPNGQSQSFDVAMTAYYSAYAAPTEWCPSSSPMAMLGSGPPLAAMYTRMIQALRTPAGDPRISVTASGPQPPTGKMDVFMAIQPKMQGQGGGNFTMIVERANVHQVSDTDKSIFGIPVDFTKET